MILFIFTYSWGVVVSNLDDVDSVKGPARNNESKEKNKSKKEKKEISEFEIRYTPLKKRLSDENGSQRITELVKEIDLASVAHKVKKNVKE